MMPDSRRVLLVSDASNGYDRRVLSGVGHYARFVPQWSFRTSDPRETDLTRSLIESWNPTGVISCVRTIATGFFELLGEKQIPLVQADGVDADLDVPIVHTDGVVIAGMVAAYFAARGVRSFGYVGGAGFQDNRQAEALRCEVEKEGFAFHRFSGEIRTESDPSKTFHRWLGGLPRPTGLLASMDWVGWLAISESIEAGFHVPDDFAVMGISDDKPWCELAPVPLSSVAIAAEKIGYQAASILSQMMAGKAVSRKPVVLPPIGIISRRSTDLIATEDPEMAEALRFVHDHALEGCSVKQLLQQVPMDRRRLERWFRRQLGRSPYEEIQRLRVAHVKRLLAETGEGLEEIASRCGFLSAKFLSETFKRETGMTLLNYRRQFRLAGVGSNETQYQTSGF